MNAVALWRNRIWKNWRPPPKWYWWKFDCQIVIRTRWKTVYCENFKCYFRLHHLWSHTCRGLKLKLYSWIFVGRSTLIKFAVTSSVKEVHFFAKFDTFTRVYFIYDMFLDIENSCVDYVVFETCNTLKEALIREWNLLELNDINSIRDYLLQHVLSHSNLPIYVREKILQVCLSALQLFFTWNSIDAFQLISMHFSFVFSLMSNATWCLIKDSGKMYFSWLLQKLC